MKKRASGKDEAAARVCLAPVELRESIVAARSAMRLPALELGRLSIGRLRRTWRATCERAKAAGLIE